MAPAVSVVVATRDRPARLAALLAGLRRQRLPAGEGFEVVVVDDGSGPDTVAELEAEAAAGRLDLSVLREEAPRGPGAARNRGWRAARAGLVAFTDDDCVPDPGWLAGGLAAHRRVPEAMVQGRTEPEPAELHHGGPLARTLRSVELGPQYPTANMFYPRELLEELSGFDEGFGLRPGGEDTDLAWRAIELGRPAVLAPDALVHHADLRPPPGHPPDARPPHLLERVALPAGALAAGAAAAARAPGRPAGAPSAGAARAGPLARRGGVGDPGAAGLRRRGARVGGPWGGPPPHAGAVMSLADRAGGQLQRTNHRGPGADPDWYTNTPPGAAEASAWPGSAPISAMKIACSSVSLGGASLIPPPTV
jgi:hypothetical protein